MADRITPERRARVERLYVETGITELTKLSEECGISRQTLSKWRVKYDWDKKRTEVVTTPGEMVSMLKTIIDSQLREMKKKLDDGEFVSTIFVKQLKDNVASLKKIDDMFFTRGMMMMFGNRFLDFAETLTDDKAARAAIARVLPKFIESIMNE